METLNRQGFLDYFAIGESTLDTNFPAFCASQLKKGILITKHGKGKTATYDVEKVPPQTVDKSYFSSRQKTDGFTPIADNETWITTYCSENHEVSNYGRIRRKTGMLLHGYVDNQGYHHVSINDV